jgi:hypothetical protein
VSDPWFELIMRHVGGFPPHVRPEWMKIYGMPAESYHVVIARFEWHTAPPHAGALRSMHYDVVLRSAIHTTTLKCVLTP